MAVGVALPEEVGDRLGDSMRVGVGAPEGVDEGDLIIDLDDVMLGESEDEEDADKEELADADGERLALELHDGLVLALLVPVMLLEGYAEPLGEGESLSWAVVVRAAAAQRKATNFHRQEA